MKYISLLCALFGLSSNVSAVACNATDAFGFQFGQPVPAKATDVKVIYFQGGSGSGNVIRSFVADVPAPLAEFPNYAYSSNSDRKAVHSIVAFRQLIADKKLLSDDSYRETLLDNARLEIAQLRQAWSEKYGLTYQKTSESGLTWEAETLEVRSTIGTYGGEYIYIVCENKALYEMALSIALESYSNSP